MTTRTTKLYPTQHDFQNSNETEASLSWAVAYLTSLLKKAQDDPQGSNGTAVLRGWKELSLWYDRTPTNEELLIERVEAATQRMNLIQNALERSRSGMSAEAVKELLETLGKL